MRKILPDPFIQAAGIKSLEEAEMLIDNGFNSLGFPFKLDFHKEDLSLNDAKRIISLLDDKVLNVLITYLTVAEEINNLSKDLNVDAVQLHGKIELSEMMIVRKRRPDLLIIKSLIIKENNLIELEKIVNDYALHCDAFIADTFDPVTGSSGATGKIHDWGITRRLAELSPVPVYLAGGLNASNVKEGIITTNTTGVDVHTGIEGTSGMKDSSLASAFTFYAREGFNTLKYAH